MPNTLIMPDPGILTQRCDVMRMDQTIGTRGQRVNNYIKLRTIGCRFRPLAGQSIERAKLLYHLATHRVGMYPQHDITTTYKLRFNGELYDIGHIEKIDEENGLMYVYVSKTTTEDA